MKPASGKLEGLQYRLWDLEAESCMRLAQRIYHLLEPEAGFDKLDFSITADQINALESSFTDITQTLPFEYEALRFLRTLGIEIWIVCHGRELRHRQARKREQVLMVMEGAQRGLLDPIDRDYLRRAAEVMEIDPVDDTTESIAKFIGNLPELTIWDSAFNASVDISIASEFVPIICINRALTGTLERAAPILTSCILDVPDAIMQSQQALSATQKELLRSAPADAARHPYAREILAHALLDIAGFGQSGDNGTFTWHYPARVGWPAGPPELRGAYQAVSFGALAFVELHELGHVLLGHVARPRTPEMETEADQFAIRTLCLAENSERFTSMMLVGAYLCMALWMASQEVYAPVDQDKRSILVERLRYINDVIIEVLGARKFYLTLASERDAAAAVFNETFHSREFLDWVSGMDVSEISLKELQLRVIHGWDGQRYSPR